MLLAAVIVGMSVLATIDLTNLGLVQNAGTVIGFGVAFAVLVLVVSAIWRAGRSA